MLSELPVYQFEVPQHRLDTALVLIRNVRTKLTQDQCLSVIQELGWDETIYYDELGNIQLNMTDLQMVAMAACIAVVGETGGKMKKTE